MADDSSGPDPAEEHGHTSNESVAEGAPSPDDHANGEDVTPSSHTGEEDATSDGVADGTPDSVDDLLGEFVTDGDPLAGTPADAVERVSDPERRRSLLEAAVSVAGFDPIREYCGTEYGATFDPNLSTVLALTSDRPLTHLVSFHPRVPNSPFDDTVIEVGLTVLFEDGSPARAVAFQETYVAGRLQVSTVIAYEDGEVIERQLDPSTGR